VWSSRADAAMRDSRSSCDPQGGCSTTSHRRARSSARRTREPHGDRRRPSAHGPVDGRTTRRALARKLRQPREPTFPGNTAAAAPVSVVAATPEAREQLVARGLLAIESAARGRGQATTLIALFAQSAPWWDGEINARLLEQALSHSPVRGPARLLLATLAALANESGVADELSTEDLCHAAGLANSTYRRARSALLASGEVELVEDGGGRGRMNCWRVLVAAGEPQSTAPVRRARGRAPVPDQPPLLSPVRSERTAAVASQPRVAGARPRVEKGPALSRVTDRKGPEYRDERVRS
jgi:hypothetical protein